MFWVWKLRFPGSSRSGEKARKKPFPHSSPRASKRGQELLARRARVGGGLEDDQLPGPQAAGHLLGGRSGCTRGRARGGGPSGVGTQTMTASHSDEAVEVGGGHDPAAREGLRHALARRCGGCTTRRGAGPRASSGSTSKPTTGKPRLLEEERERKADVAEADDADAGRSVGDLADELGVLVAHTAEDASTPFAPRQRARTNRSRADAAATARACSSLSSG